MSIQKIGLIVEKNTVQSVFDNQGMTAIEIAATASAKVDECVDLVNGVEQTASEAQAIVNQMKVTQDQFIAESADARTDILTANQNYIDSLNETKETFDTSMNNSLTTFQNELNASKTTFENDLNNAKTTFQNDLNTSKSNFESSMNTAVTGIINNANQTIETDVNAKINALITDGTIEEIIDTEILGSIEERVLSLETDITKTNTYAYETSGLGILSGFNVLQQSNPNMSVLVTNGIAHAYNGIRVNPVDNTSVNIEASDTSNPRKDTIYINSLGIIACAKGTPSPSPVAPSPANGIIIAEVTVPANATQIVTSNIVDKRVYKTTTTTLLQRLATLDASSTLSNSRFNNLTVNAKYPPTAELSAVVGDDSSNDTNAIQALINYINGLGGGTLYLPKGTYKITSSLIVPYLVKIKGAGRNLTVIKAYNCDGITINPDWGTTIEDLHLYSHAEDGSPYPKNKTGIKCAGTSVASVNFCTFKNVDLRGWNIDIDLRYTWNAVLDEVYTLSSNCAIQLYGQTVNTVITKSNLVIDSGAGTKIINCIIEGSNKGEGLMISDSLLAGGNRFIYGNTFDCLQISNCILDLGQDVGIELTGVLHFSITNCWVSAQKTALKINSVAVIENQEGKVTNCYFKTYDSVDCVFVGTNCKNWIITNCSISAPTSLIYLELGSRNVIVDNINCIQTVGGGNAIWIAGTNCTIGNLIGDNILQNYDVTYRNNISLNSNKIITKGTGAPTTGTWKQGDMIYNSSPTAGTYLGWVCVSDGTPGVWKGFGMIQA